MQLTQILLVGLATSATAIDVFFGCSGTTQGCRGLNPNVCCNGARADFTPEIGFFGIPTNWNIQARGHYNGNCAQLRNTRNSNGANFVCLNGGWYSGAGYGFVNKKRETEAGAPAEKCVEPDTLRSEDGVMYDISGLAAEAVNKITELIDAGDNLPAEFAALKVVE